MRSHTESDINSNSNVVWHLALSRTAPLAIRKTKAGFTIVEMIMVMVIVAIMAAVAIPQFINYKKDAKNAKTHMLLGAIRQGIANQYAQMMLRCDAEAGTWPTINDVNDNSIITDSCTGTQVPVAAEQQFIAGHVVGTPEIGLPDNPWGDNNTVIAADAAAIADHCNANGCDNVSAKKGWCYDAASGQFWPDSLENGDTPEECSF